MGNFVERLGGVLQRTLVIEGLAERGLLGRTLEIDDLFLLFGLELGPNPPRG